MHRLLCQNCLVDFSKYSLTSDHLSQVACFVRFLLRSALIRVSSYCCAHLARPARPVMMLAGGDDWNPFVLADTFYV